MDRDPSWGQKLLRFGVNTALVGSAPWLDDGSCMTTYRHPCQRSTNATAGFNVAPRGFSWALAAFLAIAAPAAVPSARAATDAANAAALRSNLPASITLTKATIKQTASALHEAVEQHHDDAVDLLKIAVLAKTPRQGDGMLSCEDLQRLVQAACTAAVDKTSQLIDMAASLHPDCADSLQDLTAGRGLDDEGTDGFGVGFGPGFPGSPGFVGSPPSGSVALPLPSPTPVTSATND